MNFSAPAQAEQEYIRALRRHFHQNPELSLHEYQTTEDIAAELAALGIPVTRFEGHTGLMADLVGGKPGKTVLLRADIDALPIWENTGLPYASQNGAMHACGHDCHAAMLLGAAKLLAPHRDELCGTVRFLFQAAEETSMGSLYFIDHGCLDGVDAAFGMHIWSGLEAPLISVESGPRMSACDNFELTVHGTAAHGASPHLGCDAIVAAAAAVTQLQGYVARRHDAFQPLVITVGTIHGGEQSNIVADTVTMTGTARCFDPALRARLEGDLSSLFSAACLPSGCTAEFKWIPTARPVSNDDPALTAISRHAAETLYGPEGLGHLPPVMVSEDFAFYSEHVPTLFAFLGGRNETLDAVYPHHNECFRIDEEALPRGAALYAQFAYDYLNGADNG